MRMAALALASAVVLSGCVRIGGAEPPERLYTLTPATVAPAGTATDVQEMTAALAVLEPTSPQRLAVPRIPVRATSDSLAYLQDAVWVELPARLFQRVLAETIRTVGNRLVFAENELQYATRTRLSGHLGEMGYDAMTSSAVVRFDAVLQLPDGQIRTRRFESVVAGVAPEAGAVAAALNRGANQVAAEVAEWIG